MSLFSPITAHPAFRERQNLLRGALLGGMALILVTVGGGLVLWPHWVAREEAHRALEHQRELEAAVSDRVDMSRALLGRLREWSREHRRVFLADEIDAYPALVRAVSTQTGAALQSVKVRETASRRWQALAQQSNVWVDEADAEAGEIRPCSATITLTGSFDQLYRAVAWLSGQPQLFIPDRWELKEDGPALRLELQATVFVVREQEVEEDEEPAPDPGPADAQPGYSAPLPGTLAARPETESQG